MVNRDSSIRATLETLRSLAFGSIGAAYAAIGTALADEAEQICLINNTDADLLISDDGVNNKIFLPKFSGYVLDLFSNNKVIANRTVMYVKHNGVAPTEGSVYFEATV